MILWKRLEAIVKLGMITCEVTGPSLTGITGYWRHLPLYQAELVDMRTCGNDVD